LVTIGPAVRAFDFGIAKCPATTVRIRGAFRATPSGKPEAQWTVVE